MAFNIRVFLFFAGIRFLLGVYPASDQINMINRKLHDTHVNNMDVAFDPLARDDVKQSTNIWPNGIVSYVIDKEFYDTKVSFLGEVPNLIRMCMHEIELATCVKFVEYEDVESAPSQHVRIINGDGCWSYVGFQNHKSQELSLMISNYNGDTCLRPGIISHELLHLLGFTHEQARNDRDNYVKIYGDNVESGFLKNFLKTEETFNTLGMYDPDSVIHYSNFAFSKNNLPTLAWKDDSARLLGGDMLTRLDIEKINTLYCKETLKTTPSESLVPGDLGIVKPSEIPIYTKLKKALSTFRTSSQTTSTTTTTTTTTIQPSTTKTTTIIKPGCQDRMIICPGLLIYLGFCRLYGYQCPLSCKLC